MGGYENSVRKILYENSVRNKIVYASSVRNNSVRKILYDFCTIFLYDFCTIFASELFCSNNQLHIILNRTILEFLERSSFFNYWRKWTYKLATAMKQLSFFIHLQLISIKKRHFKVSLKIFLFNTWKSSTARRFANAYALKWYEVRHLKK